MLARRSDPCILHDPRRLCSVSSVAGELNTSTIYRLRTSGFGIDMSLGLSRDRMSLVPK